MASVRQISMIAVVVAIASPGCSLRLRTEPVPTPSGPHCPGGPVLADAIVAAGGLVWFVFGLVSLAPWREDRDWADAVDLSQGLSPGPFIVGGGATAAIAGGSALYGLSVRSRCRDAAGSRAQAHPGFEPATGTVAQRVEREDLGVREAKE